jgi:hypothetical protein
LLQQAALRQEVPEQAAPQRAASEMVDLLAAVEAQAEPQPEELRPEALQ